MSKAYDEKCCASRDSTSVGVCVLTRGHAQTDASNRVDTTFL